MKIVVIHGQCHKGITYAMTQKLLECLARDNRDFTVSEFFLPKDGPDFCVGCNSCFLKGEENCPSYQKTGPIAKAVEAADVIILDSPNYVMEMSGSMKNLMDHLAYRWVTHRPHGSMFQKTGVALCSSAGAPAGHTARSMAKQLKWMGVPKVYTVPFIGSAMTVKELSSEKNEEMERKISRTAHKILKRTPRPSLRGRLFFFIFRGMQSSKGASWNPVDRDWWVNQGWTEGKRPWKG